MEGIGLNIEVGRRIKTLRKARNETQAQMGEKLGVVQQSIAAWEAGRTFPAIENIVGMNREYGVTADYILGIAEDPEVKPEYTLAQDMQLADALPDTIRDGVAALIRLERAKYGR